MTKEEIKKVPERTNETRDVINEDKLIEESEVEETMKTNENVIYEADVEDYVVSPEAQAVALEAELEEAYINADVVTKKAIPEDSTIGAIVLEENKPSDEPEMKYSGRLFKAKLVNNGGSRPKDNGKVKNLEVAIKYLVRNIFARVGEFPYSATVTYLPLNQYEGFWAPPIVELSAERRNGTRHWKFENAKVQAMFNKVVKDELSKREDIEAQIKENKNLQDRYVLEQWLKDVGIDDNGILTDVLMDWFCKEYKTLDIIARHLTGRIFNIGWYDIDFNRNWAQFAINLDKREGFNGELIARIDEAIMESVVGLMKTVEEVEARADNSDGDKPVEAEVQTAEEVHEELEAKKQELRMQIDEKISRNRGNIESMTETIELLEAYDLESEELTDKYFELQEETKILYMLREQVAEPRKALAECVTIEAGEVEDWAWRDFWDWTYEPDDEEKVEELIDEPESRTVEVSKAINVDSREVMKAREADEKAAYLKAKMYENTSTEFSAIAAQMAITKPLIEEFNAEKKTFPCLERTLNLFSIKDKIKTIRNVANIGNEFFLKYVKLRQQSEMTNADERRMNTQIRRAHEELQVIGKKMERNESYARTYHIKGKYKTSEKYQARATEIYQIEYTGKIKELEDLSKSITRLRSYSKWLDIWIEKIEEYAAEKIKHRVLEIEPPTVDVTPANEGFRLQRFTKMITPDEYFKEDMFERNKGDILIREADRNMASIESEALLIKEHEEIIAEWKKERAELAAGKITPAELKHDDVPDFCNDEIFKPDEFIEAEYEFVREKISDLIQNTWKMETGIEVLNNSENKYHKKQAVRMKEQLLTAKELLKQYSGFI